jgi:outer membrane protein assembly factor BamB
LQNRYPMNTDQFLDEIAKRGLLTAEQVSRLRAQVAKSEKPILSKALAKHLIDNGLITLAQAQAKLTQPAPVEPPVEEELTLTPLESLEELQELTPVEETPAPKRKASPAAKTSQPAQRKSSSPKAVTPAADELVELEPVAAGRGDQMGLLSGGPALTGDGGPLLATKKKRKLSNLLGPSEPKKLKKGQSEWESPFLLFGGGALLLLIIIGAGVFFLYLRGSGDQQFKLAEDAYRGGSYTQAIENYTAYLEKNPKHPSVSLAKVHRGLSRLKQATQSSDFSHALKQSQIVLAEIEQEKEFPEARLELRSILPDIAEGLAKDASKQKETAAVKAKLAETEEALKLVMKPNYIPQSQVPMPRITSIREVMAAVARNIEREAELTSTLERMKTATEKQDIPAAYAARKQLLKTYPDLAENESLGATILTVAAAEKSAIQLSNDERPAESKEAPSALVGAVALAARTAPKSDASGPPATLLAEGAVYAFDSGSGKLLWRRHVGLDSPVAPLPVDASDGSDVLVVDSARNELVRVASKTGQLTWRQPIGERIAGASVLGPQAIVTTFGGKLLAVELKSGAILRSATLPQGARLGSAASASLGRAYQVGEQSTLYVFDKDLACHQAFYLGHDLGTIAVLPILLPKHVLIAENRGSKSSILYALSLGENGKIDKVVQKVEVPGHILTPPVVADRKLVMMSDSGDIKVMSATASNPEQPLADLAIQPAASGAQKLLRHLLVEGENLWIADKQLVRYKVQSAAGRLMPSPLEGDYENASYEQAPIVVGKTLVHARRPTTSLAVVVAGTNLDNGARLWETQIAAPPAGEPATDDRGVAVVSSAGQLFSITNDELTQHALDYPATTASPGEGPTVLSSHVDMKDAGAVFSPSKGSAKIFVASPKGNDAAWNGRFIMLPESLACAPAKFGKGLIVPTTLGQVFWLNVANGKPVAAPFQTQLSAGSDVRWTTPDATADGRELIISDGSRLYRITLAREPAPHLQAITTSDQLAEPITTPVAVIGSTVVAGDNASQLRIFKLPDLSAEKPLDLGASVIWGPRRFGTRVLLTTANDELVCVDQEGKIAWQQPLEKGPLAGSPALANGELIVTTQSGHVVRMSLEDGKTLAASNLGQPLGSGPVAHNDHWLVASKDGTLLIIDSPQETK